MNCHFKVNVEAKVNCSVSKKVVYSVVMKSKEDESTVNWKTVIRELSSS